MDHIHNLYDKDLLCYHLQMHLHNQCRIPYLLKIAYIITLQLTFNCRIYDYI